MLHSFLSWFSLFFIFAILHWMCWFQHSSCNFRPPMLTSFDDPLRYYSSCMKGSTLPNSQKMGQRSHFISKLKKRFLTNKPFKKLIISGGGWWRKRKWRQYFGVSSTRGLACLILSNPTFFKNILLQWSCCKQDIKARFPNHFKSVGRVGNAYGSPLNSTTLFSRPASAYRWPLFQLILNDSRPGRRTQSNKCSLVLVSIHVHSFVPVWDSSSLG